MPLYEYVCKSCGESFEIIQKFSDPPPEKCPHCGSTNITKKIGAPSIRFKGSGWYITDYANVHSAAGAAATSDSEPTPAEKKGSTNGSSSSSASTEKSTANSSSTTSKSAAAGGE